MGGAASVALLYTRGSVDDAGRHVRINVFVTFSLRTSAMIRYWRSTRDPTRGAGLAAARCRSAGRLVLCAMILVVNVVEKFTEGGWLTMVITGALVALCMLIRATIDGVGQRACKRLDADPRRSAARRSRRRPQELDPKKPTAVVLAGGFGGLGLHTLLQIHAAVPGPVPPGRVRLGRRDRQRARSRAWRRWTRCREQTEDALRKYVEFARGMQMRWPTDRMSIGTEAVSRVRAAGAGGGEGVPRAASSSPAS